MSQLQAKVLTVSDGVVHGTRDDASGRALVEQLRAAGFEVVAHELTADGPSSSPRRSSRCATASRGSS
jgi:molybdopterin biosynthesis enzyme MoaB